MRYWSIEVRGTHSETDRRAFDQIVKDLLETLPPRGFTIAEENAEFDVPDVEPTPEAPPSFLGLSVFNPTTMTGAEVRERVPSIDDLGVLDAGAALERRHDKYDGGRVKVLGYIESRIQKIIG